MATVCCQNTGISEGEQRSAVTLAAVYACHTLDCIRGVGLLSFICNSVYSYRTLRG